MALEKLKEHIGNYIQSEARKGIDAYLGTLVENIREHPESLEQFYPVFDKIIQHYVNPKGKSGSGTGASGPGLIPSELSPELLTAGVAKFLPARYRMFAPLIAPHLAKFIKTTEKSENQTSQNGSYFSGQS